MPLSATARSTRSCFLPTLVCLVLFVALLPFLFSPCSGICQSRSANGADQAWNFVGSSALVVVHSPHDCTSLKLELLACSRFQSLLVVQVIRRSPPPPTSSHSCSLLSLPPFFTLYTSETTARCTVQVLAGGSAASTPTLHPPTHLFSPSAPFFAPYPSPSLSLCLSAPLSLSSPPSFPASPQPPGLR